MNTIDEIFERAGGYLQLDLKYYVKNASYLISANIVSILFGLLLSIAFARLLSKEVYGQYNYILSIIGIFAIFSLPGMGIAITQAVARGHDRVLIEGTKEKFKWSILGSVAVFLVGIYYYSAGEILLGKCFLIASLFFPFYENFQTFGPFLVGKKEFGKTSKYHSAIQSLSVLTTIFVVYFSRNLILIIIAYLTSFSLLRGYFFVSAVRKVKNDRMDADAITFGKHMSLMNVFSNIATYLDRILLANFLGFEELAIYAFAIVLPEQIKGFMKNIGPLTLPKLAVMDEKTIKKEMRRRFVQLAILTAIIIVVYILCAPFIYKIMFPQYIESIFYSRIFMLSFISAPTVLITTLFQSKKKKKELYIFNITQSFFLIATLSVLIPFYGIMGAIIARILMRLFGLILVLILFKKF